MIRLNLLPDIKREYLHARRMEARVISAAILISIIAVALVVLVAIWVYGVQTVQRTLLTGAIESNYKELKAVKDIDKYVTVQNQLTHISGLHEKKAITSRVFDVVPKLNPKAPNDVKISNLDVDTVLNTMSFEGETSTFTGLETFRDTLKNAQLAVKDASDVETTMNLFSEVIINSQSLGKAENGTETRVSFRLTATYDPKLFSPSSKTLSVTVPNIETTQSKQDAPDVFGEKTIKEEP